MISKQKDFFKDEFAINLVFVRDNEWKQFGVKY